MTPSARSTAALVLVTTLSAACSSEFMPPASDPHVVVTMKDGMPTYVREGKSYPHGFAGSGLVEATKGVPEAEAAASTFRNRNITGLLMTLGGVVVLLGTSAAVAAASRNDGNNVPLVAGGLLGALALTTAGSVVMISALPYQWDAVNLYNHSINQRQPMALPYPPPGYAPPGYPGYPPPGYPPGYAPPAGAPPAGSAPARLTWIRQVICRHGERIATPAPSPATRPSSPCRPAVSPPPRHVVSPPPRHVVSPPPRHVVSPPPPDAAM